MNQIKKMHNIEYYPEGIQNALQEVYKEVSKDLCPKVSEALKNAKELKYEPLFDVYINRHPNPFKYDDYQLIIQLDNYTLWEAHIDVKINKETFEYTIEQKSLVGVMPYHENWSNNSNLSDDIRLPSDLIEKIESLIQGTFESLKEKKTYIEWIEKQFNPETNCLPESCVQLVNHGLSADSKFEYIFDEDVAIESLLLVYALYQEVEELFYNFVESSQKTAK